jgi:peptide/nickel transport system permease protein
MKGFNFQIFILLFFIITGFTAPLICNKYPIAIRLSNGSWQFPVLLSTSPSIQYESMKEWEAMGILYSIRAPIPFSKGTRSGKQLSPPSKIHWMGTDRMGRDVLTESVFAIRSAAAFVIPTLAILLIVGVSLGFLGGLGRSTGIKIHLPALLLFSFLSITLWGCGEWLITVSPAFYLFFIGPPALIAIVFAGKFPHYFQSWNPDSIIMRTSEWLSAIPRMLLILIYAAVWTRMNYWGLALMLGLTAWPGVYRMVRSFVLQWRNSDQALALNATGISFLRKATFHILPAVLWPIMPWIAAATISLLMLEASLSFLNVGLPPGHMGWGGILAQSRNTFNAWWLWVFPSLWILLALICAQRLGKSKTLNPDGN